MSEIEVFAHKIAQICPNNPNALTIEQARHIVKEINDFLYTNYEGIGNVEALGEEFEYFSEFHRYWHENHREILSIEIDERSCHEVAATLHEVYLRTGGRAFSEIYDTRGLSKEDICRVRFLSANQDFRGSRSFEELTAIYLSDNSVFDEQAIFGDPEGFVRSIGITGLSQNDKRVQFAKNIRATPHKAGTLLQQMVKLKHEKTNDAVGVYRRTGAGRHKEKRVSGAN